MHGIITWTLTYLHTHKSSVGKEYASSLGSCYTFYSKTTLFTELEETALVNVFDTFSYGVKSCVLTWVIYFLAVSFLNSVILIR